MKRNKIVTILALLLILLSLILTITSKPIHYVDDAWITFRYANNLAHTGMLSFNPEERIEGISNLLWAVILAFQAYLLPVSIPVIAAYSAVLLIAYSLYRIWRLGVFLEMDPIIAALPAVFLITTSDLYRAATNGLELPLCMALLLDAIYYHLRGKHPLSFMFLGLLFLTRIETIAIGILFFCTLFLMKKPVQKPVILKSIAVYVGFVLFATIFRLLYYHDFIPNSVRAKQVAIQPWILLDGVRYVLDFIVQNPFFFVMVAAGVIVLLLEVFRPDFRTILDRLFHDTKSQLLVLSIAGILFSFVVVIRNGGDWMPNFRLFFLYGAFYACLFILLFKKGIINVILGIALLIGPFIHVSDLVLYRIRHENITTFTDFSPDMFFWGEAVDRLAPALTPSDKVSAEAIGYIGFNLPDTFIHDPLGLTDNYIARNGQPAVPYGKTDIEYTVNTIHPSVMIWHYTGHLKNLDPALLDTEYKTFCYENCESWNAHVVMVRTDRVYALATNFQDWSIITIKALP